MTGCEEEGLKIVWLEHRSHPGIIETPMAVGASVPEPACPDCFLFIFEANETFSVKNDTPFPTNIYISVLRLSPKTTPPLRKKSLGILHSILDIYLL